ncbi:MAG: Fic family protein [Endomicrobia bacterium]|nr:Fic family protein [Endomicrobiia bacterium]
MYIYENKKWPRFVWEENKILNLLVKVRLKQGLLLGKMQTLGFYIQGNALLESMTEEILKSNKIEGEILDIEQVRSSIACRFGIDRDNKIKSSRNIDGIVEVMYDATHNFDREITEKRLCAWHKRMFPDGKSGPYKIDTGKYRNDKFGPMQVVSGPVGMEKVHYQAPCAKALAQEMGKFIDFINSDNSNDDIIKAAIAHLWFVIIHPFDDGNGRIARAITELLLARSESSSKRFYSMSSEIEKNRKTYYKVLEAAQKSSLNITNWLEWFLNTLLSAIENSAVLLKTTLAKADFWKKHEGNHFNKRQNKILNLLLDGLKGNLTSTKWAKINKVSHDTATRDIAELVSMDLLTKEGAGRNTHYKIKS